MRRETTARERREDREARAGAYFQQVFRPRLAGIATIREAQSLAADALLPDHPGRPFHERLSDFLTRRGVPPASGLAERLALMALARRLEAAGEISTEELQDIEERFRRASPPPR